MDFLNSCHEQRWVSFKCRLASIHDMKNVNTEDLSLCQDSNGLWEREDQRGESGISYNVVSLLLYYLSDLIKAIQIFSGAGRWNFSEFGSRGEKRQKSHFFETPPQMKEKDRTQSIISLPQLSDDYFLRYIFFKVGVEFFFGFGSTAFSCDYHPFWFFTLQNIFEFSHITFSQTP